MTLEHKTIYKGQVLEIEIYAEYIIFPFMYDLDNIWLRYNYL